MTTPHQQHHSPNHPPQNGPGRPRVLDDVKMAQVIALLSAGCGLREAARYVRCDHKTITREADRNPDFQFRLQRAIHDAHLSPLQAMRHAMNKHWRAAAWLLERTRPGRFGRPMQKTFTARQARALADDLSRAVRDQVSDPLEAIQLDSRITSIIATATGHSSRARSSTNDLTSAKRFFADLDRQRDSDRMHDVSSLLKDTVAGVCDPGHSDEKPASQRPATVFQQTVSPRPNSAAAPRPPRQKGQNP